MTTPTSGPETWPDAQRAIWHACRHPTGAFVDFPPSEIEQSIPERFATQVRRHAQRPAVIGARGTLSYEALWGERALTEAAFSSDPDDAAARRYRTGDLGSLRADGCLEHHGRKDEQVKIRGYRVETAAVEAALLAHPEVKEVAVVAQAHRAGSQRLVAYLVPAPGAAPGAEALREFAAARLAEYMVPSAFVVLDALPRTHTGKVNRQRLPPVARVRADLARPFAPPRSPLEAGLAALWADVLDLDAVGVHDPFVELGGDSLLALRLVNDIHATWRVSLPQAALLKASTVEAMAQVILESLVDREAPETMAAFLSRVEGTGPAL